MESKFAIAVADSMARWLMISDEPKGTLEQTVDTELAEVREVLDDLVDDGCYNSCWQRWSKERDDDQYHSDACQRARALYEKLEIK